MMQIEFEEIAEDYHNIIEPMYMARNEGWELYSIHNSYPERVLSPQFSYEHEYAFKY